LTCKKDKRTSGKPSKLSPKKACSLISRRSNKRQAVYNIIHSLHELQVKKLAVEAEKKDIVAEELREILRELEQKGLVYTPKPGIVGCVDG